MSGARGFATRLLRWHERHGRHDLPWSGTRDPYRVWLSEVMLQQTQVASAIPYHVRFLAAFPEVQALAAASQSDVLKLWAGLGYYARARNLHACARRIVDARGGVFPHDAHGLAELPGIGRSTAAAIAAFCFKERVAILDGNVKRVLARIFGIDGYPGAPTVQHRLWALATSLLPPRASMPAYTQALMDLGATVCTRRMPRCDVCPLRTACIAWREHRVDALPTPRPVKSIPVRRAYWLIVIARRRVLLQRQPEPGLWGGLLAPPQFRSRAALRAQLAQMSLDDEGTPLPERRHGFTHFTLRFVPYLVRAQHADAFADIDRSVWLRLTDVTGAELPAPVRRLLGELAER